MLVDSRPSSLPSLRAVRAVLRGRMPWGGPLHTVPGDWRAVGQMTSNIKLCCGRLALPPVFAPRQRYRPLVFDHHKRKPEHSQEGAERWP
jgi:hypothetical protein